MSHITPRLSTAPPFVPHDARIEVDARPGTPLGGPFTTHHRPGLTYITAPQLQVAHLTYLRYAYRHDPQVKKALDSQAMSYRYGHNHVIFLTPDPDTIGENIITAVTALARRLPPRESFTAAA